MKNMHVKVKQILESLQLKEFPVKNYGLKGFGPHPVTGKDRSHSFQDKRDRELLMNPTNIKNIQNIFRNTDYQFNLYFINQKGARKWTEHGKVTPEFIEKNFGIDINEIPNYDDDDITIFYVGNVAAEKVPMTAWTIAHRFAHAIRREYIYEYYVDQTSTEFYSILNHYYDKKYPGKRNADYADRNYQKAKAKLFNAIGSMRSARENKITRPAEFYHELFAQFLQSGKVTFRKTGNEELDDDLDRVARGVEYYINDVLLSLSGKIFVM